MLSIYIALFRYFIAYSWSYIIENEFARDIQVSGSIKFLSKETVASIVNSLDFLRCHKHDEYKSNPLVYEGDILKA